MMSRRVMLLSAGAALAVAAAGWQVLGGRDDWPPAGPVMAPAAAYAAVQAGSLALVDIRTPEEWHRTGIPKQSHAVTMHQAPDAFAASVLRLVDGDKTRPVALICESGYRSSVMRADLERRGFTKVVNVAEGMGGGRYGAGWLKAGLPVQSVPSK